MNEVAEVGDAVGDLVGDLVGGSVGDEVGDSVVSGSNVEEKLLMYVGSEVPTGLSVQKMCDLTLNSPSP